jgi:hypothetical protein
MKAAHLMPVGSKERARQRLESSILFKVMSQ